MPFHSVSSFKHSVISIDISRAIAPPFDLASSMNSVERPRSARQQRQQQQQQQQQQQPAIGSTLLSFGGVRFQREPPYELDMDDDVKDGSLQHMTPPRQHALRTRMRGYVDKVDIGSDHQVKVADYAPPAGNQEDYRDDSRLETLLWAPSLPVGGSEAQLLQYMTVATRTNNYNVEQAITVLQAHNHDYAGALAQVSRYANTHLLWSATERQRFDLLLARHGARFERIREAMPWRGVAELLDHYYAWVPTQHELSYPQQLITWRALRRPSGSSRMKLRLPVLPEPLLPQPARPPPPPPLSNAQLLSLAQDNSSAWQCADFVRQVGLLQSHMLLQRAQLQDKSVYWLEDWDELRRALKLGGSRNFRIWRPLDKQLLALALEQHGANFPLIARLLRSKTEQQVRQYYEGNISKE